MSNRSVARVSSAWMVAQPARLSVIAANNSPRVMTDLLRARPCAPPATSPSPDALVMRAPGVTLQDGFGTTPEHGDRGSPARGCSDLAKRRERVIAHGGPGRRQSSRRVAPLITARWTTEGCPMSLVDTIIDDDLAHAFDQNEKLVNALYAAREQVAALKEQVDRLCAPPSSYGVYLSGNEDGTINVLFQGRKAKVNLHPSIDTADIKPGQELVLNDSLNVVQTAGYEIQGEVVVLDQLLEGGRALVTLRADEQRVVIVGEPLSSVRLQAGEHVLLDGRSGYLLEKLPKSDVEELALEVVPDVGYDDIGGLGSQIESIKDAVELPYLYADHYTEHQLAPPKGVLLYGPPGCGKTMIAKAVANNLAQKISERRGEKVKGFFLNIKGPELLNKYVGETERKIREIFIKAREKAAEDVPVIVFFDEMDALFRTRGSGISSDVETTIVPQLLAEIDGVEGLKNVIVIGASNRQDLIDPAILRPGRLDVKVKIERPDAT